MFTVDVKQQFNINLFCKCVSRLLITFEDQGKYWHILLHSILIWKEEDVTLRDLTDDGVFFAIAIDSRLSPAKVRWRQPAVSSELSLVTAS